MMSFLCQPSAVAPSSQASYVNLEPSSSNSHENCFIENNCDRCQPRLPSSDMNCPSMFLNGCRCTFRAVANQRCYSNDSSGSFVPTSGINPVSTKASSTSGAQCIADQIECARDDVETVGQVEAISVDQLASSLSQLSVSRSGASDAVRSKVGVVVDCRGFVAFNTNHVNCAFNASCGDRFARKRLMDGKVTIAELVSGGPETDMSTCDSRDRYRLLVSEAVADGSAIVAYDDNTTDVTSLPVTHPLRVLTEYLKKTGATIKFLSGKFNTRVVGMEISFFFESLLSLFSSCFFLWKHLVLLSIFCMLSRLLIYDLLCCLNRWTAGVPYSLPNDVFQAVWPAIQTTTLQPDHTTCGNGCRLGRNFRDFTIPFHW